ncbi:putative capsid protein [Dragonfly larvae associated circular virus-2]|uniref:Putative capsid protein n=1 Tax=Dragonfly larvae associated circular virus-2 TaxID=1454023 RepID=W5U1V2_9VIRU|nr:putative capsid protein [Dragonfly larvae associated circular virus-2]AHH31463.1 putative capsid protein [Dragonfly larvae associated circular virus-2]
MTKLHVPYMTPYRNGTSQSHGKRFKLEVKGEYKRTHSQTTTEKAEERMHGDDVQSGITGTGMSFPGHSRHKDVLRYAQVKNNETYGLIVDCVAGSQATVTLATVGNTEQCIGKVNPPGPFTTSLPVWKAQIDAATVLNSPWTASDGSNNAMQKINIGFCHHTIDFTNVTNAAAVVDVYVVECKQDIPAINAGRHGFLGIWAHGEGTESGGLASQTVTTTTATLGSSSFNVVGAKPTDISLFKKYYKVLKAHCMHLGPGATEVVNISSACNVDVDIEKYLAKNNVLVPDLADTAMKIWAMKGSFEIYCIARGTAMLDTNVLDLANTTTAPVKLAVVVQRKYQFNPMKYKSKSFKAVVGYQKLPFGVPAANLKTEGPTANISVAFTAAA